jgi:hypothetical protein
MAAMSNVTEDSFAGMVTVDGIPIAEASLFASVTSSAAAVSVLLRETVAVVAVAPAFSAIEATAMLMDKVSWSVTSNVRRPPT